MVAPRLIDPGRLLGLNNRLALSRMTVASPSGAGAYLRVADNVDLSGDGFIRRRKGFALSASGRFHSLWADELGAYAVADGDLVRIDSKTLARAVVVLGVGETPVSYARLPDGMVYWSNGLRIGRIDGATARAAVTAAPNPEPTAVPTAGGLLPGRYQVCFTALGPDGESASTIPQDVILPTGGGIAFSGLAPSTRIYATSPDGAVFNEIAHGDYLSPGNVGAACSTLMLAPMPAGAALAHCRGSLLVACGRFLHISEPYRYGLTDPGRGFIPFPDDISLVQPCEDGLYVCADRTYWLPGDPLNTAPTVVLPFGGLPGSAAFDPRAQVAYWQSPRGVVVARPGGQVEVPQDAMLTFSKAASGATMIREQSGDVHIVAARFDIETT